MRLALLIASLMACLLAAPLAAFGAEKFEVVTLGGAGRVTDRVLADFDGDGRPEIVLLDGRRASIYRAADGDWDASVPWRFDLAADAICFDVGQVDAIPETREIVLVTPDGVRVHAFRDGRPSPRAEFLIRTKTLASRGPEDALFRRRILHDLDGDGLVDLVLPTARGFALHHQARDPDGVRPGRWTAAADGLVPFRLHATFSPGSHGLTGAVRGSTGIPDFHVLDFDGDGRRDFALDDGRKLTIHRAGEDGRIRPTEPTEIDLAPLA
ncbi:MAG: VCBS repeat-containing protein, partial [Planctomycetota bacterium]